MALTAFATGTQTTVITTEHFLCSPNEAGVYTLHVDTINMAAGDVLELRVYQMILTGGMARVAYCEIFTGAQRADDVIKISVPISNELAEVNALRFSLKQVAGSSRNFPWKVLKHA